MPTETRFREDKAQRVAILCPVGKLTIAGGDVAFREALEDLMRAGEYFILVDMSRVKTIDSSGVAELKAAKTTVSNRGGRIRLFAFPNRLNRSIAHSVDLISVLDILEDEEEAVRFYQ